MKLLSGASRLNSRKPYIPNIWVMKSRESTTRIWFTE
jgi:hypothetical protein